MKKQNPGNQLLRKLLLKRGPDYLFLNECFKLLHLELIMAEDLLIPEMTLRELSFCFVQSTNNTGFLASPPYLPEQYQVPFGLKLKCLKFSCSAFVLDYQYKSV